ncbi:hypothetical protein R3P38DRAFT_1730559 [Favolaschia claudopus]|uniref:Uncharacterized protein n=1 Tax=Favolaschia claudopus TaxID=2862362 RepID=A0AAW0A8Y4_9AGAR
MSCRSTICMGTTFVQSALSPTARLANISYNIDLRMRRVISCPMQATDTRELSLPTIYGAILLRIEVFFNSTDVDKTTSSPPSIQPRFTSLSLHYYNTHPSVRCPTTHITSPLPSSSSTAPTISTPLTPTATPRSTVCTSSSSFRVLPASFNPASDAERVAATLKAAGISLSSESYLRPTPRRRLFAGAYYTPPRSPSCIRFP